MIIFSKHIIPVSYTHLDVYKRQIDGKLIYKQNIHSLLENSLIQEKYLTEISKNGYSELLKKVNRKEIKPGFFEKFKSDLGFDPYLLFPINSHLSCYGYLFEQQMCIRDRLGSIGIGFSLTSEY